MAKDFIFNHHVVNGLYPVADAFATTGSTGVTDRINMANYNSALFIIHTGVATGGTANGAVTLNCYAAASGGSGTAVPFKYRQCASSTSVDTWQALTDAPSNTFSMHTGSNYIYEIQVNSEDVEAAAGGNKFIELTVTESSDDPVVAGILCILTEPRMPQAVPLTAIA
jgi:hypothetical protein